MNSPQPTLAREFASALAWWQAAGVDCDFHDDATAWLAEEPIGQGSDGAATPASVRDARQNDNPAATKERPALDRLAPAPPPLVPARENLLGESPPADLAAFRAWWMEAGTLDTARGFPRVPPRGEAGAKLMVLVPQPEDSDRRALLEGPQGRLLAAMLAAMGLTPEQIYLAATLPAHRPMADLASLAATGMDAVTAHHIGLAAPQRLLVLGGSLAPMLGATAENGLREFNHAGGKLPVIFGDTLEAMLHMPRLKARFWRRWMECSATL